jgi:hypothetical protein
MNKNKTNGDKTITHNKINGKLGLINKDNHNIFYLECGAFIIPTKDCVDFNNTMKQIQNNCKRFLKMQLKDNQLIDENFIMNFEICSDRMMVNKQTYFSCQYHFKQKYGQNLGILNIKNDFEPFFQSILDNIEHELSQVNISINKKKNKNTYLY